MMLWPISVEIVTAATAYPVTLSEAKSHLRVDHTDEDSAIQAMIAAATDYVGGLNGYTGRSLLLQTYRARYESFGDLKLPYSPAVDIDSITYSDGTVSTDIYELIKSEPAYVTLKKDQTWPTADARSVYVRYHAGYRDSGASPVDLADNVPQAIKSAILLIVGSLYEHREGVALINGGKYEANPTVKALLNPYRVNMGM